MGAKTPGSWVGRAILFLLFAAGYLGAQAPSAFASSPAPWGQSVTYPASTVSSFSAISCPQSTTTCFAVGSTASNAGVVAATTNGGASWSIQSIPDATPALDGIACPSENSCYAIGNTNPGAVLIATTNGGATWNSEASALPRGMHGPYGIACPSTSDCYIVGRGGSTGSGAGAGIVVATTNGGSTWTTKHEYMGTLYAVACPTKKVCYAVGDDGNGFAVILETETAGATWKFEELDSSIGPLASVSCSSFTTCSAVAPSFVAPNNPIYIETSNEGGTWFARNLPEGIGTPTSVSCVSAQSCYVGTSTNSAATIVSTKTNGKTWKSNSIPSGTSQVTGLACESSSDCFATGEGTDPTGGLVLTNGSDG